MRAALLATCLVLAALAAGCGGDEIRAEEVPGPPQPLALPVSEDAAPGAGAADTGGADSGATGEDGASGDDAATGTDTGATATPQADTGGATAPAPSETEPAQPDPQDPAETGGADADAGLDQFCADNPGAC